MAILRVTEGPQVGRSFDVSVPLCVMGRHPDCDITVEAGAVSRRHAQVVEENGKFFLEDLGSRNGTFLNEDQVQGRVPLSEGDSIQFCDVTFVFADRELLTKPRRDDLDSSGYAPILVDDESEKPQSTIRSTLNVTATSSGIQLSASPEMKLDALLKITTSLGKAISLDEVLPQVLESLFSIFVQADRGFIVLKNEKDALVPRWTKIRREDMGDSLRISRTIANHVIDSKEAVLSADAASDERFELSQSIADFRIRSVMCVPLIDSDEKAFGVLQIDTQNQGQRFNDEDLEVLASVASQAAIAIDNAQLHEQALKQRALDRDLDLAHKVQQGFLPEQAPEVPSYQFFDFYQPANQVGGDYYDYVPLPDGRIAVIVADVVGHGVAAALLMAKLSAQVRFSLATQASAAEALSKINYNFCQGGIDDRFVTMVMTILDPSRNEVTVVNAGHMAPMRRRPSGKVDEVGEEVANVPIGIIDNIEFEQYTCPIEPGEVFCLYTDGINEAMNAAGDLYGSEPIFELMESNSDGAPMFGKTLMDDVGRFTGDHPHYDDMCVVCFSRDDVGASVVS